MNGVSAIATTTLAVYMSSGHRCNTSAEQVEESSCRWQICWWRLLLRKVNNKRLLVKTGFACCGQMCRICICSLCPHPCLSNQRQAAHVRVMRRNHLGSGCSSVGRKWSVVAPDRWAFASDKATGSGRSSR